MSTKVSIIEVNLQEINTIIDEEIQELTDQNRAHIETLLAERRAAAEVKSRQAARGNEAQQKIEAAYAALLAADESGIPAQAIAGMVGPMTLSAFTLRMKTYLKQQGNAWVLVKKKIAKQDCYALLSYNQEPE